MIKRGVAMITRLASRVQRLVVIGVYAPYKGANRPTVDVDPDIAFQRDGQGSVMAYLSRSYSAIKTLMPRPNCSDKKGGSETDF